MTDAATSGIPPRVRWRHDQWRSLCSPAAARLRVAGVRIVELPYPDVIPSHLMPQREDDARAVPAARARYRVRR